MRPLGFEALVPKGMKFVEADLSFHEELWENGRLLIWEAPRADGVYAVGVDCSEGVGGDNSVVEVIRIGRGRESDTQVAEFASNHHGPAAMAPIAAAIGRFYADYENDEAVMTVEANALGQVCLQDLRLIHNYGNLYVRRAYDRFQNVWVDRLGFVTSRQSRGALVARGLHAMQEGHLVPVSEFLLQEMEDFEGDWNLAQAKAKSGRHDDRVMAFMLAYWGAHEEEWVAGEDPVGDHARLTAAASLQQAHERETGRHPDYQNTAITYEDAMAKADEEIFG